MLESDAWRTECGLSYDPPDPFEGEMRPIGECSVCDEPTEILYLCSYSIGGEACNAPLCPECVSGSLQLVEAGISKKNLEKMALCPTCPGACSRYFPDILWDPEHLNPSEGGNRASDDYW